MRRNAHKLTEFQQTHHISKAYTSAAELLNDPDVDAVYVATPPGLARLIGLTGLTGLLRWGYQGYDILVYIG